MGTPNAVNTNARVPVELWDMHLLKRTACFDNYSAKWRENQCLHRGEIKPEKLSEFFEMSL